MHGAEKGDRMEEWKRKLRELGDKCFEGEVTVPKTELWLVLTACFLASGLYGLKKAPMTHGVMIACNNGSYFGCPGVRKGDGGAGDSQDCGNGGKNAEEGRKCRKKGRCCGRGRHR